MITQRSLTDEEKAELDALNAGVQQAIETRRAWLDVKMVETSRLQVGDDIYDVYKGHKVGVVTELYRYHAGRDDRYDITHHCYYKYRTGSNSFDNTSRQGGRVFGTRVDAARHAEIQASRLRVGAP